MGIWRGQYSEVEGDRDDSDGGGDDGGGRQKATMAGRRRRLRWKTMMVEDGDGDGRRRAMVTVEDDDLYVNLSAGHNKSAQRNGTYIERSRFTSRKLLFISGVPHKFCNCYRTEIEG